MGRLLTRTLPLALGAALSPTMFVVELLMLGSRVRPRLRAAAYGLGAALVLVAVGVAALLFLRRGLVHGGRVYPWIDIAFAAAAAAVAVRRVIAPAKPPRPRSESDDAAHAGRSFVLGIAMMLTNFSTLVLFVPAMKEIAAARAGAAAKAATAVVVFVVTCATLWAPLLLATTAPARSDRLLRPLDAFMRRHARTISVVVSGLFAVYLLVKGLRGL